jgi:hypothetical protein
MSGYVVEIDRRFGGHGGVNTEWEIRSELEPIVTMVRLLPKFEHVQISVFQPPENAFQNCLIILHQGTPPSLAGAVAANLAAMDIVALSSALKECDEMMRAMVHLAKSLRAPKD